MKQLTLQLMKLLFFSAFLSVVMSCQTKEERVIADLEKLAIQIEQRAETYSDEDWQMVIDKYKKIHRESMDCDFTEEQLKELGRVEGKLTTVIAKEGSKKISRDVKDLVKDGKSVVEGFLQGLSESVDIE